MPGQLEWLEIIDRLGKVRLECRVGGRTDRGGRGEVDGAVEEAEDCSGEPAKQAFGAGRDRFEYRRRVRR